jgi:hypothetical protein
MGLSHLTAREHNAVRPLFSWVSAIFRVELLELVERFERLDITYWIERQPGK